MRNARPSAAFSLMPAGFNFVRVFRRNFGTKHKKNEALPGIHVLCCRQLGRMGFRAATLGWNKKTYAVEYITRFCSR